MSTRKVALTSIAVLVSLIVCIGFVWHRRASRRAQLVDVVLGPSRLWTIYSDEDDHGSRGGEVTLECIDRATGERLWSTSMDAAPTGPSMFGGRGSQQVGERLLFATSPSASETGLVALKAATGEELWRSRAVGAPWTFGTLHTIADVAVLMTVRSDLASGVLTAVNLDDGTERWVATLPPDGAVAPCTVLNSLVFASERGAHRVDAGSGRRLDIHLDRVSPGQKILPVFHVGKGRLGTFEGGRWLEAAPGDTTWTTMEDFATPEGSAWSSFELPECAVGRRADTVVLLLRDGMHRYDTTGDLMWSLPFAEGFEAHPGCRRYDPSSDVTARYPTRYAPLVLSRRIEPGRVEQQLVVIDLDEGSLSWHSAPLAREGGAWTNAMLFRSDDFYGIPLVGTSGERERWFFFGLDGRTGTFTLAIDLEGRGSPAQLSLDPPHHPWLVDRDVVMGYGREVAQLWGFERRFWCRALECRHHRRATDQRLLARRTTVRNRAAVATDSGRRSDIRTVRSGTRSVPMSTRPRRHGVV